MRSCASAILPALLAIGGPGCSPPPADRLALADRLYAEAEALAEAAKYEDAVAVFGTAGEIYETEGRWARYVRCRSEMGEQSRRQARLDQAQAFLDEALKAAEEHLPPRDLERARTYGYVADVQHAQGDYAEAVRGHTRALDLRRGLLGPQHADVASSYVSRAHARWIKGDFGDALADAERALAIQLPLLGDRDPEVAWTRTLLANVHAETGHYDRALALFDQALPVLVSASGHAARRLASAHSSRAVLFDDRGDYDRALVHYQEALSLQTEVLGDRHPDLAGTYNNIGTLHDVKGDADQALAAYEKALALHLAAGRGEHAFIAYTYGNMGLVFWRKGDHEQAIAYLGKARSILLKTLGDRHPETASPDLNLGLVYTDLGNYEQAIACYEKALTIQIPSLGPRHTDVASSYNNMGAAYAAQGDYSRALSLYQKALEIRREALGPRHPDVGSIYRNLGTAYRRRGETARAIAHHERALAIYRASFGPRHPEVARSHNDIGDDYRGQHRAERAIFHYQQAIRANLPSPTDTRSAASGSSNRPLSESLLLDSLNGTARALADPDAGAPDLAVALRTFEEASSVLERVRRGYRAEGSKLFLAERGAEIHDHAIRAALALHGRTGEPRYADAAFRFSERGKSGILLDALVQAEAVRFAGIPDAVLAEERRLRSELAFYEQALAEEQSRGPDSDPARLALWRGKYFDETRTYDALLERLEKQFPEYYSLKYRTQDVDTVELRRRLGDAGAALVEYFVGADSIFIFVVSGDGLTARQVPRSPSLERWASELRTGIVARDFGVYADAAFGLYDAIVRPVAERVAGKALVVVPDGVLGAVPFEALLTRAAPGDGWHPDLPYVLGEHQVSYAYSASLWLEPRAATVRPRERGFVGFAPATARRSAARPDPRADLPASRDEVERISKRVERSYGFVERWQRTRTRIYLGDEAREAVVKSEGLSDYRFVHFATHGLLNAKDPKLSGLVLAPDPGAKDDGILHLGEVYGLRLDADLVALSACETGLGRMARGEGILGLTRGFLYAGASSVLVSLWPVSDATTADLMVDFYDQMLLGASRAEALREAKRRLMKRQPEYAKPYYWAPFILVGR